MEFWCIADLEYQYYEDKRICPWIMNSLKPIQLSNFDIDQFVEARKQFSLDEWIDLLIQSIGFNPEMFGVRSKLLQLIRLIPYCERNYNLIELGPKGTGKSHIYSEFSPHGILLSGGEVSVPKLFVNNSTGRIGLVGYWDAVAFDEFAGKKKRSDKALVDILKNYMANKSFSRGIETLGAEASLAFVGNTQHTLPYMLKHTDLFDDLPEQYYDTAFLDRLHFYIPGWEVDIIRGEMFSDGYGFVVDYLAEILRAFRNFDFSNKYSQYFTLSTDISTRDRDGINKTFSGLFKILFPGGEATQEEVEILLRFAMEGRKRVKDQIMRIDRTFVGVDFSYSDNASGEKRGIQTLEQEQYPQYFLTAEGQPGDQDINTDIKLSTNGFAEELRPVAEKLSEKHISIQENQKGVSFDDYIGPYLKGAKKIVITDPYIRVFFQVKNLMELLETIVKQNPDDVEVDVELITASDGGEKETQEEFFQQIQENLAPAGINFTWRITGPQTIHARHIVTDHGWKILLDRGLDVFQRYEMNDTFSIANKMQKYRSCKAFEITYIKL